MDNNNLTNIKEQGFEFIKGIGTIILYIILVFISQLLFQDYYFSNNIVIATSSQLATYLIMLIGLVIFYHKRLINDFKNFKKENINIAFRSWIAGFCLMAISNIIISFFTKDIAANESLNRSILIEYPISNIITMVLIGPLIEEITFRASFQKAFKNWIPFCLFTALIFGIAHIAEPSLLELLYIIPYGSLGFFFAYSLYKTNNIYTSFIAHMFHNALCVLFILL